MICPTCGSEHIVKFGTNITVAKGRQQRMQCQDYGRSFYAHEARRTKAVKRSKRSD